MMPCKIVPKWESVVLTEQTTVKMIKGALSKIIIIFVTCEYRKLDEYSTKMYT